MNRSAEQINRVNREKKIAVYAICLFRTAIHFPWTEKKDSHSLYLQCLQQRPLLKFSEQSKKFKFPAEIGHLTLFQDKTILAYSFRQNSAERLDPNLCKHARHLLKLHWAQFVPVLEWLKTGNELGVYINIHIEC